MRPARCCGSRHQEISVQAGAASLALLRCTRCGRQQWSSDGALLDRDEALGLLAGAYRDVPLRAQAARERSAAPAAARQAARAAQRRTSPTKQRSSPLTQGPSGARSNSSQQEGSQLVGGTAARPDVDGLRSLLGGWQVLGAHA